MSEPLEVDLLAVAMASRVGLISEEDFATLLDAAGEGAHLKSVACERANIDDDCWRTLLQLAKKQCDQSGQTAFESIGTIIGASQIAREAARRAASQNEAQDLWKTVCGQTTSNDPLATTTTFDSRGGSQQQNGPETPGLPEGTRFKILKPHAAGGLGEVFFAVDDELNREVALKQIQVRFSDNEDAQRRFLLEAEVTGGLEHPGVVPVYGLGTDRNGQLYYAMRFIRGQSMRAAIEQLHAKCHGEGGIWNQSAEVIFEARRLLSRLTDVCQAIGYAHSRGVLHRDIKPENVMLGDYGETLVVDWGLAKVEGVSDPEVSGSQTFEDTLVPRSGSDATLLGQVVGTPGYMSPEQAGGVTDALDLRSDIYALGASLYHLLVGHPAIGNRDAEGNRRSVHEVLQATREGDFRRPRSHANSIPKPLAAICERAMSVAPKDRYASAVQMADEIERWLADEPVDAYEESAWEKTRRWIRNHQSLAASVAAVVLVSILGLGGFSLVLNQKNVQLGQLADSLREKNSQLDERGKALQQSNKELLLAETKARDEADTARAVTEFLNDDLLAQASLQDRPDPNLKVRTVLDRAARDLDAEFTDRPLVKANLLKTIGVAYGYLGQYAEAEKSLTAAAELYATHLGNAHSTTIETESELAAVYATSGQYQKGEIGLRQTLRRLADLHGEGHETVVETKAHLADLLLWLGDYEAAEPMAAEVVEGFAKMKGRNHVKTLESELTRATIFNYTYRWDEAIDLCKELLPRAGDSATAERTAEVDIKTVLAQSLYFADRIEEAEQTYDQALEASRRLLGPEHPSTLAIRHDLALLDVERGNPNRALTEFKELRRLTSGTYGESHRETVIVDQSIADALAQLGRLEEARDLLIDALTRAEKSLASSPETDTLRFSLARVYFELEQNDRARQLLETFAAEDAKSLRAGDSKPWDARVLLGEMAFYDGQYDQAIRLLTAALAGYKRTKYNPNSMQLRVTEDLIYCYVMNDETAKAVTALSEMKQAETTTPLAAASASLTLIDALIEAGQVDAGEARIGELIDWARRQIEPDQETLITMLELAGTLGLLGRLDDAVLQYEQVLQSQIDLLGTNNIDTLETLSMLASTLERNDANDEAIAVAERLLKGQSEVYGPSSEQVLLTHTVIAELCTEQAEHPKAIEHLLQVRRIQEESGVDEADVRSTDATLADAYRLTNDYQQAIKHYKAAAEQLDSASDDPPRLLLLHQLAWCYERAAKFENAITTYDRVIQGRTDQLGTTHQYTLLSLGNLAQLLASKNDSRVEERLREIKSRIDVAESTAPGVDDAAYALGQSYRQLKRYDDAATWYRKCIEFRTEALGDLAAETLLAMHQLAYTLSLAGDHAAATEVYEKVVPGREQTLGDSHAFTLLSLTNWGIEAALNNDYDKAIRILEDGVQRVVKLDGRDAPLAIKPRLMLASAHYLKGNYTRAIQLIRVTLEVTYRKVRKTNDQIQREIAMLQIFLADAELHAGRPEDAFQHANEGLSHKAKPNDVDYFRAQSILGEVYRIRGDLEKAIELLNESVAGLAGLHEYPLRAKLIRHQIDAARRMLRVYEGQENRKQQDAWRETIEGLKDALDQEITKTPSE